MDSTTPPPHSISVFPIFFYRNWLGNTYNEWVFLFSFTGINLETLQLNGWGKESTDSYKNLCKNLNGFLQPLTRLYSYIVGSGACNPPFLFSTHPFYEKHPLYWILQPTLFTYVFDTVGSEPPVWSTSNILSSIIGLEIISPYLTMSIKQNSYNQHFVNSYNV